MRFDAACAPVFARHETFQPRFGWLKKAVDAALRDPDAFNNEDAVVALGVGKNMVKSMRFWGTAHKLLVPAREAGSRQLLSVPTVIGRALLADDGWDPYSEFDGTQWLLHWMLLSPPSIAPVWWLALNEFSALEFDDDELSAFVIDRTLSLDVGEAAIRKDVACFIRMYLGGRSARSTFDDAVDCPTRSLQLLVEGVDHGRIRFNVGRKASLPPAIAAFASLDFVARAGGGGRTISVSSLAAEPGTPGQVFKLGEQELLHLLEAASAGRQDISITESAGAPQLAFDDDPAVVGTELLFDYYRSLNDSIRHPGESVVCGPGGSQPTGNRAAHLTFMGLES
ncbi:MAG: DUF4007 family protein [Actinomycetes bacterium]